MFNSNTQDSTSSFVKQLSYWQQLNFFSVLIASKHPDMPFGKARLEAQRTLNDELLTKEIDEALNSPNMEPREQFIAQQKHEVNDIEKITRTIKALSADRTIKG